MDPASRTRLLRTLVTCGAGLLAASLAAADGGVYQESGGLVVIEIESTPPTDDWLAETDPSGYTFRSFYRWNGRDHFGSPTAGVLTYRFHISTTGNYSFRLRNRHDDPDSTMENDAWTRMDGGTWYKTFSNGSGTVDVWNWVTRFDIPGQPNASWFLTAGTHEIQFAARSFDFMMDRFHLSLPSHPDATNANAPESVAILGTGFCSSLLNSSGQFAEITVSGSSFFEKQDVRLFASRMPQNEFGYFLTSPTSQGGFTPPGSSGLICLGTGIARFDGQVQNSGASGSFEIVVDTQNIPSSPVTSIMAGDTWYWQGWFRDGATSNFTRGRIVQFQ